MSLSTPLTIRSIRSIKRSISTTIVATTLTPTTTAKKSFKRIIVLWLRRSPKRITKPTILTIRIWNTCAKGYSKTSLTTSKSTSGWTFRLIATLESLRSQMDITIRRKLLQKGTMSILNRTVALTRLGSTAKSSTCTPPSTLIVKGYATILTRTDTLIADVTSTRLPISIPTTAVILITILTWSWTEWNM